MIQFATPQDLILYSIAILAIGFSIGTYITVKIVSITQNNHSFRI